MSKKLSITIMAHPERKDWAEELSQQLNAPIVYDQKNNIWDTCRRSWLSMVDSESEYSLVLQDDAILCTDFINIAEKVLNRDLIYSFYAGNLLAGRLKQAQSQGDDILITNMIFNEVAICMPTKYISEMIEYCDKREATTDQEIGKWARQRGIKICNTIPSLVDHRDTDSIFRRNYKLEPYKKPRRAVIFKG